MSKLMLIHPNDQKAVYGDTLSYVACEPPYWMAVVAQYCLDRKIQVSMLDAEAENISFDEVADRVNELKPDLIGIFVTGTNLSASTQKMQGADTTCHYIKEKNAEIPIFFWGLHPSALPERTLKENEADYIVSGEGFDTIVELCSITKNDLEKHAAKLSGLYYQEGPEIKHIAEGVHLLQTNDIPMPAWELLPMDKYMPHNWHIMGEDKPENAKGRYAVLSTSIGCPYNCSFCAISALFGTKRLRYWDIDRIVGEIDRLVTKYNIKYIKILDECFVLNKRFVSELCEKIAERQYDLNIWAYARVDTVDRETLAVLRSAGVRWLAYGIESASDEVLSEASKSQYNTDQTREVMRWTKEANINIIANFMFGLSNDTIETMEKTLSLAKEICPEWINFYVTMLYPGSKDYFDAVAEGKISNDKWIEYAQYSYECKPSGGVYLSPKEVLAFRDSAFNRFFENNEAFFANIDAKFGNQYSESIKQMSKKKLRRKLLEM